MVKICQTELQKLNFETRPKNAFSRFCQKFPQAMDEVDIFFCQFPNPWALRVSGMGGYTSKCEKSQNHCTLLYSSLETGDSQNNFVLLLSEKQVDDYLSKLTGKG